MIETTKALTDVFMKARNFLFVRCRERERNKQKMVKIDFLKFLLLDFG